MSSSKKIKLHGFNNLTKSLSFNIYDICYTASSSQRQEYIEYIDEEYNAKRLINILKNVAEIIKARVLSISHQDYEPLGASVTMLISEELSGYKSISNKESSGHPADGMALHLDKSHIAVHTYPESHPNTETSTFRVDIDVSTCGRISPLKALNYLLQSFDSDIVIMDYKVRGFTRDLKGKKQYIDHKINSIQNYLSKKTKEPYQMIDVNVYQENLFHTKMLIKEFDLDNYLFGIEKRDLSHRESNQIIQKLKKEMLEIFHGRNITVLL